MTTHILIADSSSLTIVGAETLLKGRADTAITKAENGSDLITAAETIQPDIILLGIASIRSSTRWHWSNGRFTPHHRYASSLWGR